MSENEVASKFVKGEILKAQSKLFTRTWVEVYKEHNANPAKFVTEAGNMAVAEVCKRYGEAIGEEPMQPASAVARWKSYNLKLGNILPALPAPPSNKPKKEGSNGKKGPQFDTAGNIAEVAEAFGMTVEEFLAKRQAEAQAEADVTE